MLLLELFKLKLKSHPQFDVLDDFDACNPFFWKSLFKSPLNVPPFLFNALHVVLCDVIVCKVVFHNIPPVLWEVQFLKSRKFVCKPFIRLQVSPACDFNYIRV